MKKIICWMASILLLMSCSKETCMSCIAESRSGVITRYIIECNKSSKFLKGYADGLRQYYKDKGDSIVVYCIYGQ